MKKQSKITALKTTKLHTLKNKRLIQVGPKVTTMPTTAFLKLMTLIEELYEVKDEPK